MSRSGVGAPVRVTRGRIAAVVLVAALGIGSSFAGTGSDAPQRTNVVAQFKDASPLLAGNDVKVDGVKVGSVSTMTVAGGHADVMMQLDAQAMPMHTDATAEIRPVSLLGERYVELHRGTPSAPLLPPSGTIPTTQTSQNTDLDQVLDVLDKDSGSSMAALVTMLGKGMQGNGPAIADTVRSLAPAMQDTDGFVGVLNGQNATLNRLVGSLQPVAASLAQDNGRTMDGLVGSAHDLLGATARDQRALRDTLARMPATMDEARGTLAKLTGAAHATTPNLRALRPATDNLQSVSQELDRFADAADPALAHAQPVLEKAQTLVDAARPVSAELVKASGPLRADVASAKPLVNGLANNVGDVMNFIRGWALATNGKDGLGHYFRAATIVDPKIISGMLPPGPMPGAGVPGLPGLPGVPGGGTPGPVPLPPPTGGLLAPRTSQDGGVTGMNQNQESGALQFLLGGK